MEEFSITEISLSLAIFANSLDEISNRNLANGSSRIDSVLIVEIYQIWIFFLINSDSNSFFKTDNRGCKISVQVSMFNSNNNLGRPSVETPPNSEKKVRRYIAIGLNRT
jgi:hypothetical protein